MKSSIGVYKVLGLIILAAYLVGCAHVTSTYSPPSSSNTDANNYTKVINKPFDNVWTALIKYSAGAFFSIDNFEKDSGLITLSFGSSKPSDYIDGGKWTTGNYTEGYVDYLDTLGESSLNGKMNIIVIPITADSTQVTVKARYIYTSTRYNANSQLIFKNTWSFDTGGSDSVNMRSTSSSIRTMQPTHEAERAILKAVEELSTQLHMN